jgi:hypothetical protein
LELRSHPILLAFQVALCAIFILPDFPTTTSTWLSPTEARLAQRRMEEDFAGIGDEGQTEKGHVTGFISAMTDWKVWWLALALTSMVVSLSFNAFFPTLSATMGFNRTVTLLLCAPVRQTIGPWVVYSYFSLQPWIFATLVAFAVTRSTFCVVIVN